MKKWIRIFIILIFIIILGNKYVEGMGMTGYEKGTFVIEITLQNSNGNNKVTAWSRNYNNLHEYYKSQKKIEEYKKALEIKERSIKNNIYKYKNETNIIQGIISPYIEITRNNGEIDSFSYNKATEIMLRKEIPIYLSYDCEKGIFMDNTDYNKVEKIKEKEEIIDKILEFKFIIIIRNCSYYIN